jgi:hypothetical protein
MLRRVDPERGLTDEDFAVLNEWFKALPSMSG